MEDFTYKHTVLLNAQVKQELPDGDLTPKKLQKVVDAVENLAQHLRDLLKKSKPFIEG